MSEVLLTVAVVLILILGPFWLIKLIGKKSPLIKDRRYIRIRGMLREALLPLGFVETQSHSLVSVAKYRRDRTLVEIYFDTRDKEVAFFASHEVDDSLPPPRQVAITFPAAEYNAEKKKAIRDALYDWIRSIE